MSNTLKFDVMCNLDKGSERYVATMRYPHPSCFTLDLDELWTFIIGKRPSLKEEVINVYIDGDEYPITFTPWINAEDDLPYMHEELIYSLNKCTFDVIVYNKYYRTTRPDSMFYDKEKNEWEWFWNNDWDVVAWRPLPEYKKGGEK